MSCTSSLYALKPLLITNNTISFDFFDPQSSLLSCSLGKPDLHMHTKWKILLPIMHMIFDPCVHVQQVMQWHMHASRDLFFQFLQSEEKCQSCMKYVFCVYSIIWGLYNAAPAAVSLTLEHCLTTANCNIALKILGTWVPGSSACSFPSAVWLKECCRAANHSCAPN